MRRHTAYAAFVLTGFNMLNGAAGGPSNLKLVASWMICGTFGTGVTCRFIGVPPFVPPGNGWLKKPAGTVKPPVPFTFTTAGVMPARSAPPGMQPPGFGGRGPISFVCVFFAGEYPPPKPILPVIPSQGPLPAAGDPTKPPEPVAALPRT